MITPWGSAIQAQNLVTRPNVPADSPHSDVVAANSAGEPLIAYSDDTWKFAELISPKTSLSKATVNFSRYPEFYRDTAKRIAWCLFKMRLPVERIRRPMSRSRERIGLRTLVGEMNGGLLQFFSWLDRQGSPRLSDLTERSLEDYRAFLHEEKFSDGKVGRDLFSVCRIWLLSDYLPVAERLIMPPWERTHSPRAKREKSQPGENITRPIHPETMSSLLVWADRFINIFSDDITEAHRVRTSIAGRATKPSKPGDAMRFRQYATQLLESGKALPGYTRRSRGGESWLAGELISGTLGIGIRAMTPKNRARIPNFHIGDTAPVPSPIKGVIGPGEEPWLPFIDYFKTRLFRAHLATACVIVTAYLSGMRVEEIRTLRRGSIEREELDGGQPPRYMIRSLEFKSAIDPQGNSIPGGRIRERPWYVIEPVAKAIRIAESLADSEYVFDAGMFVETGPETRHEAVLPPRLLTSLDEFISWVNEYCVQTNRIGEGIPPDPEGRVHYSRFRRTLAWFIYRRPQGRVALGVQYGHLRGYTSEGYGSRRSTGHQGLMPMDEALAIAENLAEASDRLSKGEGISGPAAQRYIAGVKEFNAGFRNTFDGRTLTQRQMTALKHNPRFRLYDHGIQPVACSYDATKALCHPENKRKEQIESTPDLTRCVTGCANAVVTDHHAERMQQMVTDLENAVSNENTPIPMRQRYEQRIRTLKEAIGRHEREKVVADLVGDLQV